MYYSKLALSIVFVLQLSLGDQWSQVRNGIKNRPTYQNNSACNPTNVVLIIQQEEGYKNKEGMCTLVGVKSQRENAGLSLSEL